MKTILLLLAILFSLGASPLAHAETVTGIASVIDGDTLDIHGRRIRLHGIDAPESGQTCGSVRCGQQAAFFLEKLIGGRTVSCQGSEQSYNRLVAKCHVGGRDLGQDMVAAGAAMAYSRYSTDYVGVERAAKAANLGFWATGGFQAPWDYRAAGRGQRSNASRPTSPADAIRNAQASRTATVTPAAAIRQSAAAGSNEQAVFRNCAEARAAGAAPLQRGQAGYSSRLDRDGDGRACE